LFERRKKCRSGLASEKGANTISNKRHLFPSKPRGAGHRGPTERTKVVKVKTKKQSAKEEEGKEKGDGAARTPR